MIRGFLPNPKINDWLFGDMTDDELLIAHGFNPNMFKPRCRYCYAHEKWFDINLFPAPVESSDAIKAIQELVSHDDLLRHIERAKSLTRVIHLD